MGFLCIPVAIFKVHNDRIAGLFPATIGGDGLSRYRTDFHEIEVLYFKSKLYCNCHELFCIGITFPKFNFLVSFLTFPFYCQQIGRGNFSSVFKVLKRIDGCLYAVKRSSRQLRQETER